MSKKRRDEYGKISAQQALKIGKIILTRNPRYVEDYTALGFWTEHLLRLPDGRTVLVGEGNANTIYASGEENGCTGHGTKIFLVHEDEVDWVKENPLAEEYNYELFIHNPDRMQEALYSEDFGHTV